MTHIYATKGVCSRSIEVNINDDEIIESIKFKGGCGGNTTGIAKLAEGMKASDAIARMKGIPCGSKSTSCPDQLALALEESLELLKNSRKPVEA